ncbi:hypothetical protein [Couchioplanes caeruleus]|nr:hypothetical protein [Couchioplanes caeruleus]
MVSPGQKASHHSLQCRGNVRHIGKRFTSSYAVRRPTVRTLSEREDMIFGRYGRRKAAAAVVAAISVVSMLEVALPNPAHAASYCHTQKSGFGPDRPINYAILHGTPVTLMSDSANASAYVNAELKPGDVLSIDRSNFEVRGPRSDHNWPSNDDVARIGGTWDYCETFAGSAYGWMSTPRIDGAHRAVRGCLRRNGEVRCQDIWYADNDDDRTDWFPSPGAPSDPDYLAVPRASYPASTSVTYSSPAPVAFQANTSFLYHRDSAGRSVNTQYGMMTGTSPATSDGQVAFQANTSFLYTRSASGVMTNTGYGMMAGTSPAISGGQVAFQANTGFLWTRNTATGATFDTRLGMMRGTSPSIAGNTSSWRIAMQANTTFFYTRDSNGAIVNTGYGMMPGTSPSITKLSNGGYAIAFQANTGFLWVIDSSGRATDTRYGMMAGTSPAISASGTGFTVAFQANTGMLWTRSSTGAAQDTGYGMMAGTSPAIRGSRIVFQANTSFLYVRDGSAQAVNTGYGMMRGASPAV